MSAALGSLTAEWSQLQAECKATGRAAECGDLLRPAVERVRALVREAPCPDGWSRLDYMFGHGNACDVPVVARDIGALLALLTCVLSAMCCAYLMSRLRAHGAAHKSAKYNLHSLYFGTSVFAVHEGSSSRREERSMALTRGGAAGAGRLSDAQAKLANSHDTKKSCARKGESEQ